MIHATVQTRRVVFTISGIRAATCRIILLFFIWTVSAITCHAQGRMTIPLDGLWRIKDSHSDTAIPSSYQHTVPVPGLANLASPPFPDVDRFVSHELAHHPLFKHKSLPPAALDAPIGVSLQERNYFWYRKNFKAPGRREVAILKINKAQFGASVWLNGKKIGEHKGCFTAGYFNLTEEIKWDSENQLDVCIGAHPAVLPHSVPAGTDLEKLKWTPGIYDHVSIIVSDNPVIEMVQVAPRIGSSEVLVQTLVKNYSDGPLTFDLTSRVKTWREEKQASQIFSQPLRLASGETRSWTQTIGLHNPKLWTPEDPFLYVVETGTGGDTVSTRFGMREFRFDSTTKRAYLNGKVYYLRGSNITLHRFFEDPKCGALPWDENWVRKLLVDIPKRMHWNSFRFCIGPVPDQWLDIADEAGLLIQNEFFIWTFPDWHREWDLIPQFQEWMRDNWNHPSVAIWDSSNETRAPLLGQKIIPAVRALDLSNRPWENGWNPPAGVDDPIEQHNYILSPPFRWTDLEHSPSPDATPSNHPEILNEYGELWLNRDGTPTVLTQKLYDKLLGPKASAEERFATNAYLLAGETEYFRAHRHYAGILHFVYLTASFPGAYTGDPFRDVEKLTLDPYFGDYVGEAFKPLGVYLSFWQPNLKAGSSQSIKIMMVNDEQEEARGNLTLSLEKETATEIARDETRFAVAGSGVKTYMLKLKIPEIGGKCLLKATAYRDGPRNGESTVSRRKVIIESSPASHLP
jgi:beta-galactosidase